MLLGTDLLSSKLALPQICHLQQVYHIFGYLKASPRRRFVLNPYFSSISEYRFHKFY